MGGISGVGKSSLLDEICKKIDLKKFKIANRMVELLNVESYEKLWDLTVDERRRIRDMAFRDLLKYDVDCIFDGHFCLFEKGVIELGLPRKFAPYFSLFIVIKAPPSVIYKRRKENTKIRLPLSVKDIEFYQEVEEAIASLYSRHLNIPLHKITNDRPLDVVSSELVDIILKEKETYESNKSS